MNNKSFEEYIRSIVGYPTNNTYPQSPYENMYEFENYYCDESMLKQCYPQIYNIINPMVQKACMNRNGNITEDVINQIVDDIYFQVEGDNEINININLTNNVREIDNDSNNRDTNSQNRKVNNREDRQQSPRNPLLHDLIRILLINEFLRRINRRPNQPMPYPGYSHMPGGRPPIRPRYIDFYNNDYDLYEY